MEGVPEKSRLDEIEWNGGVLCPAGRGLARIIHDGSSRNRGVASRDGRVEPRGREAYRGPVALAMQRVNGTWTD